MMNFCRPIKAHNWRIALKINGYYWSDTESPNTVVNVISVDADNDEDAAQVTEMLLKNGCRTVEKGELKSYGPAS
jgi:hypothetical protein